MLTRTVNLLAFIFLVVSSPLFAGSVSEPARRPALQERLSQIAHHSGGRVGISATHVESGQTITLSGDQNFPLYSVVKLPLAVAVLKDVEAGTVRLDQKLSVSADDVVSGSPGNTQRWAKTPIAVTVRELLEFALVDSDNTSCDKLLHLIGGPAKLTERLHRLGFQNIQVQASIKDMMRLSTHPNVGPPNALTQLLVALQQGEILYSSERAVLFDMMARARTGTNRLRAALPPGTLVLDKTGTGKNTVNDVGLITLPHNQGHLAIAVMITDSKLLSADQEKTIAQIALEVYEMFLISSKR
jgi:beta-lactamase class A